MASARWPSDPESPGSRPGAFIPSPRARAPGLLSRVPGLAPRGFYKVRITGMAVRITDRVPGLAPRGFYPESPG